MKQEFFVCPRCRTTLERNTPDRVTCPQDGLEFRQVDGVWRFLLPESEAHYTRFIADYESVRRAEGRGSTSAAYCRALPIMDHFADAVIFNTPFYGLRWVLRPFMAKVLRRREPARFHLLVGERNQKEM